ncbi:MAG: hypothetical protein KTR20_05365, partial [Cellvibrionaceae bacterium]|nr:hypothetical protein [Cellvibrionaceae bacterium]
LSTKKGRRAKEFDSGNEKIFWSILHPIDIDDGSTSMTELLSSFHFPPRELKQLSFCGNKPRQLQTWLESLPTHRAKQTSIALYKLLPEVNQLNISCHQRLELLTILRPHIKRCTDKLADDFLKQPLNLTKNMARAAAIAQALERRLCDGYLVLLHQLLDEGNNNKTNNIRATATYNALHGLGQLFCRNCQLYVPKPPQFWQKAHRIYQLACHYGVHQYPINDALLTAATTMTAEQAYFRLLLLDCSNTNQLRKTDIFYLFQALEHWSSMVSLGPAISDNPHLYWLNLDTDEGPFLRSRYRKDMGEALVGINLHAITQVLENKQCQDTNTANRLPRHIQQALITHLLKSWKIDRQRQYKRRYTNIELDICVGLKAAHQALSHGLPFEAFLNDQGININNYPPQATTVSEHRDTELVIKAIATDMSPGGYCLKWDGSAPAAIKNGECILLKTPGTDHWQAGTIRWAQHLRDNTYVGVQILAEYAQASAASTRLDNGSASPLFRIISLKAQADASCTSLLTPSLPFTTEQTIELHSEHACLQAELTCLMLHSGNIQQFAYRQR